jgi:hypothetical protein
MQTKFGEKIGRFFFEYALLHRRVRGHPFSLRSCLVLILLSGPCSDYV